MTKLNVSWDKNYTTHSDKEHLICRLASRPYVGLMLLPQAYIGGYSSSEKRQSQPFVSPLKSCRAPIITTISHCRAIVSNCAHFQHKTKLLWAAAFFSYHPQLTINIAMGMRLSRDVPFHQIYIVANIDLIRTRFINGGPIFKSTCWTFNVLRLLFQCFILCSEQVTCRGWKNIICILKRCWSSCIEWATITSSPSGWNRFQPQIDRIQKSWDISLDDHISDCPRIIRSKIGFLDSVTFQLRGCMLS